MAATMIRVKKDKDNPYLLLNKTSINDNRLSAQAMGVHVYLLSLPDDWKIYVSELKNHFSNGRDAISAIIRELIKFGYIERKRLQDEKGLFIGYEYQVYEMPQNAYEMPCSSENWKAVNGYSENGDTVNGKSNTTKYLSLQSNNVQSNNTHSDLKTLCVEINNILGEKLTQKTVQGLINGSSLEVVNHYMTNWDKYKPFAKATQSAYFIHCIQNNIPIPTVHATTQQTVPTYANFEQREYKEEDLQRFYSNLQG